jgi:hypothetical protein
MCVSTFVALSLQLSLEIRTTASLSCAAVSARRCGIAQGMLFFHDVGKKSRLIAPWEAAVSPSGHALRTTIVINDLIRKVSRLVIGPATLSTVYPQEDSLKIDWQGFCPDLERCLLSDAYEQYYAWVCKTSPVPPLSDIEMMLGVNVSVSALVINCYLSL